MENICADIRADTLHPFQPQRFSRFPKAFEFFGEIGVGLTPIARRRRKQRRLEKVGIDAVRRGDYDPDRDEGFLEVRTLRR